MIRAILILICCALSARAQTVFTEFYCNSTGTNVNAGSTTNATATLSDNSGNWTNLTQTYLFSAATDLSGITNGMWASVFPDASTEAVYVGRISAVNDAADFVTVSNFTATGIAPSDGTGTRSIRIGGAWRGPDRVDSTITTRFPFAFVNALLTNTSLASPRFNFKSDRLYTITNLTIPSNGPMRFEGFSSIPGDNGMPKFSGCTPGAAFAPITISGLNIDLGNFMVESNGASGGQSGVSSSAAETFIWRVSVTCMRLSGIALGGSQVPSYAVECHTATNNLNGTAANGGVLINADGNTAIRCISHQNTGLNSSGFALTGNGSLIDCIGANNGRNGALISTTRGSLIKGCDFYGNNSNGVDIVSASAALNYIENCNFILNTNGYGINATGAGLKSGMLIANAFGAGTKANGLGDINRALLGGLQEFGTVTYANDVVPWVDPNAGDFRINLAAAINAGRGNFLQIGSGYTNTIGYPDIGAATATNAAAGGGGGGTIILRR